MMAELSFMSGLISEEVSKVLLNILLCFQDNPELSDYALDGLKQVMAVKSKSVLPFLVPKLTTPPVNTKALAILSSVAGEALIKHIEKILPAMIQAVQTASNSGEDGNSVKWPGYFFSEYLLFHKKIEICCNFVLLVSLQT